MVLLKEESKKFKPQISDNKIAVSAINGAPEAMQYAGEFINVIDSVGLLDVRFHQGDPKMAFPVYASSTSMHGIFIGVKIRMTRRNLLNCSIRHYGDLVLLPNLLDIKP